MLKKIILVLTIYLINSKSISEQCQDVGLYNLPSTKDNSLIQTNHPNLRDALNAGIKKGEGSFGAVYLINFREKEGKDYKQIAVKKIQTPQVNNKKVDYEEYLENELLLMKTLSGDESGRFLNFYGCKYERNPSYDASAAEISEKLNIAYKKKGLEKRSKYSKKEFLVYIFMEPLTKNLKKGAEMFYNFLNLKQRLNIYKRLFQDLKILHKYYDLSHYYIKPKNMMLTKEITADDQNVTIKFIMTPLEDQSYLDLETAGFMRHNKFMDHNFLKKDRIQFKKFDIYSLALSIFALEMQNVREFYLDDECYAFYKFVQRDCNAKLSDDIIKKMNVNPDDVFDFSKKIQKSIDNTDEYNYKLLPFADCKSLGCVILHLFVVKTDEVPVIDVIIKQLEIIESITLDEEIRRII